MSSTRWGTKVLDIPDVRSSPQSGVKPADAADPLARQQLAEAAVRQLYEADDLPGPKLILWLRSPREGAMVADWLAGIKTLGPASRGALLWDLLPHSVAEATVNLDESLTAELRSWLWIRGWGITAGEVGDQFDVRARELEPSGPRRYSVWHKAVGVANAFDLQLLVGSDRPVEVRLTELEEKSLRADRYWDYQFGLGEAGRVVETYLDALERYTKEPPLRPAGRAGKWCPKPVRADLTRPLEQIARNCGWMWFFEGVGILTDPPEMSLQDDAGRWHCESGPALRYQDGFELYAWHGVIVPSMIVLNPEKINSQMIAHEFNAEVRRVMIERYGLIRHLEDRGFQVVDVGPIDHPLQGLRTGRLWVLDPSDEDEDSVIAYVDVLNSTPEPDGTVKRYTLRVDPEAYGGDASRYLQAAVASTWRNEDGSLAFEDWRDYGPVAES